MENPGLLQVKSLVIVTCYDVHDAGGRVFAKQCSLWAFEYLDTFDVRWGEQPGRALRAAVNENTVDENGRSTRRKAADIDRGGAVPAAIEVDVRYECGKVVYGRYSSACNIFSGKCRNGDGHVLNVCVSCL